MSGMRAKAMENEAHDFVLDGHGNIVMIDTDGTEQQYFDADGQLGVATETEGGVVVQVYGPLSKTLVHAMMGFLPTTQLH